jgi:SAM-dependent methyltransferase
MRTYTSVSDGVVAKAKDFFRLYQLRTANVKSSVDMTVSQLKRSDQSFEELTGDHLKNKDVLIVGTGQMLREAMGLGAHNRVVGIDLDVMPQGWKPGPYIKLFRTNGATRAAKTVGRKVLGIDRKFNASLRSALGITNEPNVRLLQMDATSMTFPDSSFDFAYSFSVFEHLDDPRAVLLETLRVLRPGGVLQISTHLYSSEGGCHDLRIFAGKRDDIPLWAHLRPAHKATVLESCYMNEWRLTDWRNLFSELCPDAQVTLDNHEEPRGTQFSAELKRIRAAGELSDYSDEELLSVNILLTYKKPQITTKPT